MWDSLLLEDLAKGPGIPKASILKQLSEEYGVDADTINELSSPDDNSDRFSQAIKEASALMVRSMVEAKVKELVAEGH